MIYVILVAALVYAVYLHWKLGNVEERKAAEIYDQLKEEGWHKFALKQERLLLYVEARDRDEMKIFKAIDKYEEYTAIEFDQIYETEMVDENRLSEPGIYILHNKTKGKHYVGNSLDVMESVNKMFSGEGSKSVYRDYKRGDVFTVRMVAVISSGYSDIEAMKEDAVRFLDAADEGYNKKQ